MLRKIIYLIFLFFISLHSNAQTHLMGNGTINTCGGTFYDSGGNAGDYANNENYTLTFCSSVPGNCVRLNFTFFDLENNFDELTIYNGPNTASPLVGVFTGNVSPGLITGSSGCLTIVFTSDAIIRSAGWSALVSCVICSTPGCATTCSSGPTPLNDACSGALNLGSLPAPAPCPSGIGALTNTNTTNLCANPEFPYTSLLGCQPTGNMSSPASDVWYRFTITGPSINVSISGGLTTPNVGLYEGNSCASLIPRGCAIGAAGNLNATFSGLAAGTYYLQVSGGNVADQCNFTLTLQNNYDCAGCVIQSNLTAVPPPVNGTYPAGQLVNFCYTISDYNQTSANWLHGVVPSLGPGWDMSTFTPVSTTNCSGAGTWNWYNTNITSSATGNVSGPGFYYESNLGNAGGVTDGNPGNNFGDNNGANLCDWTFCFSVRTVPLAQCVPGTSLNINIDTYGDGESGSWTSVACTQDPITNFFATLNCCQAPTIVTTNPLCTGQNTGSAVATGMGASPWNYIWTNSTGTILLTQNNVPGTGTISGLAPGNYTVSVTDNNGCTSTAAFTINAAPAFSAIMNTTNLTCNNSNNGSASVVISGGTPGFSYAWSPSGSGANPVALGANTYTVTITDANGCTTSANGTVTQPAVIVASVVTKTNVDCNGGQNGSITVSTVGGTPGYSYAWSNGAAGSTISSLSAGVYTVTVTDSRGCTGFMIVGITEPSPIVLGMSSTAASCGSNNGTGSVAAIGGTPGYTYAWSPSGGSTSFASGLSAGGYNVTVTDSRGCTMLGNVVVSNSSGPTTSISSSVNVTCFGGTNGSATANVVGGAAPISYNWTPSGGTGSFASGLVAGNYTVTATDGAGCTSAASVVITSPLQLTASISNNVSTSCSYQNDGSLTVQGSGGTLAYSYIWSGGSINATDNNLLPGTYTVTITDANGCTASTTGTVTAPALLQINISSNTPATCNLGDDGAATVTVVGGTPGYSYIWSNGTVGATNTGLTAGTYTVTATDANGCVATRIVVISQATPLVLALSSTGTTCGSTNGTTSVIVGGGTPGYTYSWSPSGGTGSSASGLNAGNYSVLVTDANGCTAIGNVSVPSANGPVLSVASSNNISCPSGNDGDISINVVGGATPYTYAWSNGGASASINTLTAGTYTLTVTDNNGCSTAIIVSLIQPAAFTFVNVAITAHCGQADGDLTINTSGGTSPYTYLWSNGASGSNQINNVLSGTYTFTVSDANGCTASSFGVIPDEPAPTITLNNSIDASCFGVADGRIRVNVAGGVPPYNLLWSNGTVGLLNSNIAAGTYTVTVTDAVGCTATFQSSISEPTSISLVPSSTTATCGSANGSANIVAVGGTGPYSYAWSPIGGNAATATNLGAGSYTVVVSDANGCTEQMNVNVGSSNGPSAVVLLQTDVSCNGGNDGALTISVNGGVAPYVYAWSAIGSGTTGVGLTAGNYTVTVTDNNSCTSVVSATINEPTALSTIPSTYISHCGQADGGADIIVNGGTPVYAYNWSTGTSVNNTLSNVPSGSFTVTVTDANGCTLATTVNIPNQVGPVVSISTLNNVTCNNGNDGSVSVGIAGGNNPFNYAWSNGTSSAANSNLTAGNYTVTITDAFGCTSTLIATITEPAAIPLTFVNTISTCGNSNGSSIVTPNGGTAPYSYSWSSGSINATANTLSAGVYTVTVTDALGCTSSDNTIINAAGGPTLAFGGQTDVSCAGGSDGTATVIVIAGNGPFTYDWLPSGGTAATGTGLSAGNYKVSVTDVNGCSTTFNFDILEPLPLLVNNLTTPAFCNGGSDGTADIDAQDGTAPYIFDWSPGGILTSNRINLPAGNYNVTVTDAKGCTKQTLAIVTEPTAISGVPSSVDAACNGDNTGSASIVASGGISPYTFLWNTGAVGSQLNGVTAGTYTVTISDNNGCPYPTTIAVSEAPAIFMSILATDASCGNANGTASVSAIGGTGAFGFQWSTGAATTTISGLAAGAYTVIATDGNGCTSTTLAAVANLGGPTLSVLSSTDISCNGGADGNAEVSVTSGNGPYTYSWIPFGGSGTLATGLTAGNYTAVVTDVNGCITNTPIQINEPAALQIQLNTQQATCGFANGSATAVVSGGTGAYGYNWSNGSSGSSSINSLASGNYSVTITDANGCTTANSATISNAGGATLAVTNVTPASCNGYSNGSASIIIVGGNGPFSYNWTPSGGNAASASGLAAGNYTLAVTDVNGCVTQQVVSILEPTALVSVPLTTPTKCNASSGSAQVQISGGTGAYTYNWNNGQNTNTATGLTTGNYTVTVSDANGCTLSSTLAVSGLPGPSIDNISTTNALCFGAANGSAQIQVSSGSAPYNYVWSNGSSNPTANGLNAGNYAVTVTDNFGCTDADVFTIQEPTVLSAITQPVQMVSCFSGNNGSANTIASGGTSPYSYVWSTGANTITANNLIAGTYSVIITDQNGCTEVQSTTITQPTLLGLTQNSATMVSCFGGSNGEATYAAIGGTSPYQYLWSNGVITANNSNISAGNYTIVLTDANGCIATSSVNITQPTPLAFNPAVITNVNCFNGNDGQATVSSNGGVPPYSYQWSTGSSNASIQNLIAGNYTVIVTDANGCTSNQNIQVAQPTAITIQPTVNGIPCFGMSNASISVSTSGGVGPYTYNWSNGAITNTVSTLPQGIYTVQILDAHLCPFDTTFTITQPTALQASVNHPDTICIGQSTNLIATVSGGTAGYSYLWNTANTASSISVSPTINNTYSVLVTDANGCTETVSNIPVLVFPALSVNMTVTEDSICEGESTILAAYASGGNGGPYTYTWNAIGTSVSGFTSNPDSNYVYTVILSDGCTILEPTAQQLVIVHPLPVVSFLPIDQKGCNPVTVNFTSTSITTNGANYEWDFGDGSNGSGKNISHTYTEDGTYDVGLIVTDIYGCESQLQQNNIITVWPLPTAFYTSQPQEVSILHPIVQFLNGSSGAVASHWDFGDNTLSTNDWSPEHTFGDTGRYVVALIAISNEGCVDTFYNEIIVKGETTFYIPNAFSPNNDGYNEFFTGYGIGITHADFKVFDRWGKLMFESSDLSKGWDGTYQNNGDRCAEGVYVYLFKVYNGQPAPLEFTGKVSLVR